MERYLWQKRLSIMKTKTTKKEFTINDLPSNRKELFFDVLKNHYNVLVSLGLIAIAFLIPFLIVSVLGDNYSANIYASFNAGEITIEEYKSIYNVSSLIFSLIQCLTLSIFSIGMAGIMKVFKRLLFMEPLFFKEDFVLGIKDSWKTYLLTYFIFGLFYAFSRFMNLVNASEFIKALPVGVLVVFVLPIFLLMNTNTTIYKNSFGKRIRVSTLLHVKNFFSNMLASLILLIPLLVLFINNLVIKYLIICAIVIFLFPIYILGYFDFSLSIYDKFINIHNYPEIYRKGLINKTEEGKKNEN